MASYSTIFLGTCFLFNTASALAQEVAAPPQAPPQVAPGAPPDPEGEDRGPKIVSRAANPQNAALLALKNEQVALWDSTIKGLNPLQVLPDYLKVLEEERARAVAIEKATGDAALDYAPFQERAYFAANDGSPQPYYVMLPEGYTPEKKYPLIVFLHGYSTVVSKINPWIPLSDILEASAKRGFIFAIPYGRRNSDFVDWGEDDVRAVRDEVIRNYSVDTTRMNLLGASMGAFGSYVMSMHAPGEWNAVTSVSGRTDMYLWFNTAPQNLPAWKPILLEADNPRTLLLNGRNTPLYIQHGSLDLTVPTEHARRFVADAAVLGLNIRYLEDPKADHEAMFGLAAYERAFDWFKEQKVAVPPRHITFTTGNGLSNRAYWARIDAFEDYGKLAQLDVRVDGRKIAVKAQNVVSFVLDPPRNWWKAEDQIELSVNGAPAIPINSQTPIRWKSPGAKLDKFPGHVGPFKNLMRASFLLVYGDENDAKDANRFAEEWQLCADGAAPIKAATNISEGDKAKFNLLLFGTRATNPLLNEIGAQLPVEITPEGYRVGIKQVTTTDVGLRMVWKSPWNTKRMIGVCSGLWWGEKLPPNHKWDWIPDYIVYGTETEPMPDDTNRALEAGWFDGNWNLTTGGAGTGMIATPMAPKPAAPLPATNRN